MIETMILGFLAEGPKHGYELRREMSQLNGYVRPISDGTIYPAINRLVKAGALVEHSQPGTGAAPRRTLELTDEGRAYLIDKLRDAQGRDITDPARYFVVLAFLSLVPEDADRRAVLARRLDYLENPVSFFSAGARPLNLAEITDPYRKGIFVSAIASSRAERAWLHEQLDRPSE